MPSKSKHVSVDQLRIERAGHVRQIEAARGRIRDLIAAGKDTALERDDIAKRSIRMMEIDTVLSAEIERREKGDIIAIDRETQKLVADFRTAFDAFREALTPPSEPAHS
jgi:hypothetical protein